MSNAFVFPGQGSQAVGMARDVAEAFPAAQQVFATADDVLGFALSDLCFTGPEAALTATEQAQPAILTASVALLTALANGVPLPEWVAANATALAGHSLGEYTALVAAGALDFASALHLVRERGQLMAQATEGTMAAIIGMDAATLEAVCAEASAAGTVVIANYNAPGQLVISGEAAGVAQAGVLAKAQGAKRVLPLNVSAAFHSPLMQQAADGLTPSLQAARIRDAVVPVVGNVTAHSLHTADELRAELLAQITAPVRWIATIEQMRDAGITTLTEVGPGSVLTGLAKRIVPGTTLVTINSAAAVHTFGAA